MSVAPPGVCAPRAARALATAALLGAFSIPIGVEDGPEACEPRRHTSHMASDTTRGTGLLGAAAYNGRPTMSAMMPASLPGRRAAALHAERTPNLQLCVRDACGRVVSLCTATARAVARGRLARDWTSIT